MNFAQERSETRTGVAQLTSWCLTVALHQQFGIGSERLNRLAEAMTRIQAEGVATVMQAGEAAAARQRREWMQGKAQPDFPVPLLRAPRTRREKQLRMAGDEAAAIAWQIYAAGCIQALGFGPARLEALRQAGRDNYRQFNTWAHEDGLEVAFERLRRCVQDALREEVRVVDEKSSQYRGAQAREEAELRSARFVADRVRLSGALAVPGIRHTEAQQAEIFARCAAETADSWRRSAMRGKEAAG